MEMLKPGQQFFVSNVKIDRKNHLLHTTDISKVAEFLSKETGDDYKLILDHISSIMDSELPFNIRTYKDYGILITFNKF